jgi:hypothetical protein
MSKRRMMAIAIGVAVGVAVLALRGRTSGERPDRWEKMRRFMEEMPEDFPPRVMFDNLSATRENTERILAILEKVGVSGEPLGTAADLA